MSSRRVTASYAAHAGVLALMAGCWLAVLGETSIYARIEAGTLDASWRDVAHAIARNGEPVVLAAVLAVAAAFLLAQWGSRSERPLERAHRAYLRRVAPIALLLIGLVQLTRGRMGAHDVEIVAVLVFAWGAWAVAAGWRAHRRGRPVTGPAGWQLALAADVLALVAFVALMISLSLHPIRMF